MKETIAKRALRAVNLKEFPTECYPEVVSSLELSIPKEETYILRMLIKRPFHSISLPKELHWVLPLVNKSLEYQQNTIMVEQPFCHLTIRSGIVKSTGDDQWHTDGFSMQITHLPEQNYLWCDSNPTEFAIAPINIPEDFSALQHNLHLFIDDTLKTKNYQFLTALPKTIYCFDPYVIHRRPPLTQGQQRTFIRVSFTPIEIMDDSNTPNPCLPTMLHNREGVKDFRDGLKRYSA